MLYAYFGGLSADKRTTYELVLEQRGSEYALTSALSLRDRPAALTQPAPRWPWQRQADPQGGARQLYTGIDPQRALLLLLEHACAANLAVLGQRYCYVLPSVPGRAGALAPLIPAHLRYDSSLPLHPQLWQHGRPLDTLPTERHAATREDPGFWDVRSAERGVSDLLAAIGMGWRGRHSQR